ncbi:hypothetical protein F8388_015010, partial [Cannabis sativa]
PNSILFRERNTSEEEQGERDPAKKKNRKARGRSSESQTDWATDWVAGFNWRGVRLFREERLVLAPKYELFELISNESCAGSWGCLETEITAI